MPSEARYRTCPLCEATCGLEITVAGGAVERVRGDDADVFSRGFLCPKGVGIKELHEDPDRVRTPLLRVGDRHVPVSWDEAFAAIEEGLGRVLAGGDRNAVGVYVGNPTAHNLSGMLYGRVLMKALGSRNLFSASTVDQFPKQLASSYMFGTPLTVPVPDIDRCEWLLVLGANPVASNGSLMTAPDVRGRLKAIQRRGGRIVVVDPRRSRTAELADEHVPIRPGTDALLLFAMVHVLFAEGLVDLGHVAPHVAGLEVVEELAADFAPEAVAPPTGVDAEVIRRLARDLAAAPRGAVYGRIGTTTQAFGTVASWLVDVLNALTGNLDREGGAMFPLPATAPPDSRSRRETRVGRWTSRVRGLGEIFGELPVACLAEEIATPGEGQIRAMLTFAGNPVVSTPNSGRLAAALDGLEFMVSIDVYVNETTRFADVILPGPSPLERAHYDVALYSFAVRNVANYSPPVFEPDPDVPDEWRTVLRLTGVITGQGPEADVDALDDMIAAEAARRSGVALEEVAGRTGPERLLDLMLRAGPYDLTLADLEAAPHGVDLGPLQPRLPEGLRTPSGKVELAPQPLVDDVPRLREALAARGNGLVLVGRRDLRSNNSWMHNLPLLVRGPVRCTVHVNPADASRLGLVDGEPARVRSRVGEIELPVEVTDAIMEGVVSIPHGWGHDAPGTQLSVAREHAGANSNVLADEDLVDGPSGNAVLNGIPVELVPRNRFADSSQSLRSSLSVARG
jgi:anaerobic selenocysteine-containing dehydrogenase